MMTSTSRFSQRAAMGGVGRRVALTGAVICALSGSWAWAQAGAGRPEPKPSLAEAAGAEGAQTWQALTERFGGYKADTKPSRDATMQFSLSTEIKDVLVAGGQRVKRGEVLIRARDNEILAAKERQKIIAESTTEVENATKQVELADSAFENLKAGGTFSRLEFDQRRIEAEASKIQLEQAKINAKTQVVALKQIEGQAERFYLEAPFDGVIEEVMVEVGQGVTEQEKVLRIVNTDVLWVDAYASTSETIKLGLKGEAPAWVLVQLADDAKVVRGKVLYVSPVADSVSQTRRVRVEVANTENWPAGTLAQVRFTDPGSEWESRRTKAKGEQISNATTSEDVQAIVQEMMDDPETLAALLSDERSLNCVCLPWELCPIGRLER